MRRALAFSASTDGRSFWWVIQLVVIPFGLEFYGNHYGSVCRHGTDGVPMVIVHHNAKN